VLQIPIGDKYYQCTVTRYNQMSVLNVREKRKLTLYQDEAVSRCSPIVPLYTPATLVLAGLLFMLESV
jgi:hypothetical protein